MTVLLDPLQFAILPIFAFPAIGYAMGRRGTFGAEAARGVNGYVASLALPCQLFYLLSRAEIAAVDWPVMAAYLGTNIALYAYGFAASYIWWRRSAAESVLLGMTAAFPNHVFFALPIAQNLYGAEAALPMATMIFFDILIVFAGSVIIMEAVTGGAGPTRTLGNIVTNRILVAMAAGLGWNLSGLGLHEGVERFLAVAAGSAAPASMFALGVILSAEGFRRIGPAAWTATILRVGAAPLIGLILIGDLIPAAPGWDRIAHLALAAPCGAMAFVIGVKYGVEVQSVGKAIILSTILSVFTLAALA